MSGTRLRYEIARGHVFNPRAAREEAQARSRYGLANSLWWLSGEYAKLFRIAAEESYAKQVSEERARLADFEFLTAQASLPFAGFYVYSLFDADGDLLYVGQSGNVWARVGAHARKSWGSRIDSVRVVRCADLQASLDLESRLISELAPAQNKVLRWYDRPTPVPTRDAEEIGGSPRVSHAAVLSGADGTDGPTPCRPSRLGVA